MTIADGRTPMMPDVPALAIGARNAVLVSADGEVTQFPRLELKENWPSSGVILCHSPTVSRKAEIGFGKVRASAFDVLELFAFAFPAQFCLPSPKGLAQLMGLPAPVNLEDEALILLQVTEQLLTVMSAADFPDQEQAARIAFRMSHSGQTNGWRWGAAVLRALGVPKVENRKASGFDVWKHLAEWEDKPPPAAASDDPVSDDVVLSQLARLLGTKAESRPQQEDFAVIANQSFLPKSNPLEPRLVLAEAGTGIGKTLGYVAPASSWSDRNGGSVWLSTYTKNLQRQIDQELDRLFPNPADKARHAVIRKGRENYLCILNFEEAVSSAGVGIMADANRDAVTLGLVARWIGATRDGDMIGGDFPSWLLGAMSGKTSGLTDRRGECIYSACEHYKKCFIEKAMRKSQDAKIVVANHALVMSQAAINYVPPQLTPDNDPGDYAAKAPLRYVFDEGHHLFDAADSWFAAHLTGQETQDLRRWLRGNEERRGSRSRGLKARIEDLLGENEEGAKVLDDIIRAAGTLPFTGWQKRIVDGTASNPTEQFLHFVRLQVLARSGKDFGYSLEAPVTDPLDDLLQAAKALRENLEDLVKPLTTLNTILHKRLNDETAEMESSLRARIEAACRGITRRVNGMLTPWTAMLGELGQSVPDEFRDWFGVERIDGRDWDVGFYRHWLDPTIPLAKTVLEPAHGVLVTSATLTDHGVDDEPDWETACRRSGAIHLSGSPVQSSIPSPFDYPSKTQILIVSDVNKNDADQVGSAFRELFLASGGGGLGIFTAINRLRSVYDRISLPLEENGIPVLAQHVDPMDSGTLVDMFRADSSSCLLGTDAMRDGVDVPGDSLRLIVFDRVPWPRPNLLHKARRDAFGGRRYDEMLTRLRLKQAFGRLIRRAEDRGVFVMLDGATPTRLLTAFPSGVDVSRVGIADAVTAVRQFWCDN